MEQEDIHNLDRAGGYKSHGLEPDPWKRGRFLKKAPAIISRKSISRKIVRMVKMLKLIGSHLDKGRIPFSHIDTCF